MASVPNNFTANLDYLGLVVFNKNGNLSVRLTSIFDLSTSLQKSLRPLSDLLRGVEHNFAFSETAKRCPFSVKHVIDKMGPSPHPQLSAPLSLKSNALETLEETLFQQHNDDY